MAQQASQVQLPIAQFTISPESSTQAIIQQAQNAHNTAKRIANIPRKRDVALTTNGTVNPVGTNYKYYIEASIGYVVGSFRDNGSLCTNCQAGRGRFPFCVTVTDPQTGEVFWGGACVNCKFQNHHSGCSLFNGGGNGAVAPPGGGGGGGQPPAPPNDNDDDDETIDEEELVIERISRTRARGKGKKPAVQEEGDDAETDMDEEMTEVGAEDESHSIVCTKGKQRAVIEESDSETEARPTINPAQPSSRRQQAGTRGIAIPKKPSAQTPRAQAKSAKGKSKEGIKKNPDGSRKRG